MKEKMCQNGGDNVSNISKYAALTEKQKEFILSYRRHAGNLQKVQKDLNIGIPAMYNYLNNEKVREQINKSIQECYEKIEAAAPLLIDKAIEMVYDKNVNDKVKTQLINTLLDRGGVVKIQQPQVQININTELSDRAREILANTINTTAETI